jgi:hypothetical protein
MPRNRFRDMFRRRQRLIQAADRAVVAAEQAFRRAESGRDKTRQITAAAKKCERAAALYQEAGLGLLAKQQFAAAARYYSLCGDQERARLNQDRWAAMCTYWEERPNA